MRRRAPRLAWLAEGLRLTKIHRRLREQGCVIPYSSLHRFAQAHCGFGAPAVLFGGGVRYGIGLPMDPAPPAATLAPSARISPSTTRGTALQLRSWPGRRSTSWY